MFTTVLNGVKSPQNAGMIVRSHAAFGGATLVVVGEPWEGSRRFEGWSRGWERSFEIEFIPDEPALVEWSRTKRIDLVAIEISASAMPLPEFAFPENVALVVGSERLGLSDEFMSLCTSVVTIPQFGSVPSLNVAVAASVVMYELRRRDANRTLIRQNAYATRKHA